MLRPGRERSLAPAQDLLKVFFFPSGVGDEVYLPSELKIWNLGCYGDRLAFGGRILGSDWIGLEMLDQLVWLTGGTIRYA